MHNFSKALRYGAKFLYQSLPRLLTIWLDFAARDEFRFYDPNKGMEVVASGRDKCVLVCKCSMGLLMPYAEYEERLQALRICLQW